MSSPPFFREKTLRALHGAARNARLDRKTLLEGVPPSFADSIPRCKDDVAQMRYDLGRMNYCGGLPNGTVPFETWLSRAIDHTATPREAAVFRDARAELQKRLGRTEEGAASPTPTEFATGRKSILDCAPYPLHHTNGMDLHDLLVSIYPDLEEVDLITRRAGLSPGSVSLQGKPRLVWFRLLQAAANQGLLRRLVEEILLDSTVRAHWPKIAFLISPVELER